MTMLKKPYSENHIVPLGLSYFFQRRLEELYGLSVMSIGILIVFSLFSYTASDPSLNVASSLPPQNLLHLPGAYGADFLLQWMGFSSILICPVFIRWGWRILRHRAFENKRWRLVLTPFMLLTFSIALAPLSFPFDGWISLSPGGALGHMLLGMLNGVGSLILLPLWAWSPIFLLIGLFLFNLSCDVSWRQWYSMMQRVGKGILYLVQGISALKEKFKKHSEDEPFIRTLRKSSEPIEIFEEDGDNEETPKNIPIISNLKIKSETSLRPKAKEAPSADIFMSQEGGHSSQYRLPPLELMQPPKEDQKIKFNKEQLKDSSQMLASVLDDFGVKGEIGDVHPGPVVTLYELKPAPGTKSSRVISLADDIARSMSAISARISVIPGYNALGIELPNPKRQTVYIRELLEDQLYRQTNINLPLILGKNIGGEPVIVDLARMPHLLVAGTTGSGKSVSINTMILSLLYALPPEKCRFIMIDPKMLELSIYDGIPHLLTPVVTDPHKAVMALKWAVREMESRYQSMSKLNVRNIDGYNARLAEAKLKGETLKRRVQTGFDPETGQPIFEEQDLKMEPLPFIVVVVDEMADLMLVAGKDIESAVQRLAQMARAAGIHLIMATQRPSVDVITGTIKANFPTRISFQVTSKIDSRTILGEQGAEQLLGQGDMLYMASGGRITRVHGPYVRDDEVEQVVRFLKTQGDPNYIPEVTQDTESFEGFGEESEGSGDGLYDQALALVLRERKASTSFIQRHLQIGYNRAARIMDRMESEGVVSSANHVGKREILLPGGY
jgi:S-DNA-T family DNA segregation ATPase FtsK/SpoIIIE